ncbi:hypothetical protein J1605_011788, partial [Eschrichtius robustus]
MGWGRAPNGARCGECPNPGGPPGRFFISGILRTTDLSPCSASPPSVGAAVYGPSQSGKAKLHIIRFILSSNAVETQLVTSPEQKPP